ncbi:Uncharacterised protein [Vibrio cholerae]|nr:Uncharacterised protein [Vibrio cholerae]CSI34356.1 Uncharacterised protein [Vibrio cholerae]
MAKERGDIIVGFGKALNMLHPQIELLMLITICKFIGRNRSGDQ